MEKDSNQRSATRIVAKTPKAVRRNQIATTRPRRRWTRCARRASICTFYQRRATLGKCERSATSASGCAPSPKWRVVHAQRNDRRAPRRDNGPNGDRSIEQQAQHERGDGKARQAADHCGAAQRRAQHDEDERESRKSRSQATAATVDGVPVTVEQEHECRRDREEQQRKGRGVTSVGVAKESSEDGDDRKQ